MNTYSKNHLISALILLTALLFAAPSFAKSSLDGEISIKNDRRSIISLKVDGEAMGMVHPGERRVLSGIPNGVRLLVISGKHGPPITQRVSVPIQGRGRVQIKRRFGSARIQNNSGIRMRLHVDGRYLGTVAPGSTLVSRRLRPGQHTVTARPVGARFDKGQRMVQSIRVRAGQRSHVSLGQFMAQMKVTNSHGRRVKLFVDGQFTQRLRPGQTVTVRGLAPGAHRIVMKRRGRTVSSTRVRLTHGQHAFWAPPPMHRGRLRVTNHAARQISVSIDGRNPTYIRAGGSITLRHLSAGVHDLTIQHGRGRIEERRVRIPRSEEAQVVVQARRSHPRRSRSSSIYVARR